MSNVLIEKDKLDVLATAISNKSGESLKLTLAEMVEAVDGIETGGGGITPTGNIDITHAGQTDVTNYATATVPDGILKMAESLETTPYISINNNGLITADVNGSLSSFPVGSSGWLGAEENAMTIYVSGYNTHQLPTQSTTTITPTESQQTAVTAGKYTTGAVTVSAIPSNYVGSGITQRSSSDLTASTLTVTAPSGYYASNATKTLTDANLVAGNIKKDVQIFGVTGDYEGGSGSDVQVASANLYSASTSALVFTGLQGEPTSFIALCGYTLAPSATPQVVAVVYDGTNLHAQTITNTNNAQVSYASTGFSYFYNLGALQIESTGSAVFDTSAIDSYLLLYTYDGTSGNIQTADVQVGSGATSITFTGLEDEPLYWSLIFKSNFGTSSGYQRVITAAEYSGTILGYEMDSSAHPAQHWTSSYSGGSLTISSNGTNQGGYFHQPGYYQLTYAVSGDQTLQTKTVTPTTSTQNVTADTAQGYTALKKVVVNPIPSSYVEPTSTVGATTYRASTSSQTIASGTYHSAAATIAAVSQTNLTAANIKSGTTITISNGQSNLWSVTGTYTGGGGGATIDTKSITNDDATATSIQFTGLSGTPLAFFVRCTTSLSRSSSYRHYYVATMEYNGTNTRGNRWYRYNGQFSNITSGYSYTYSNGTLTLSSSGNQSTSPGSFYNGTYELVYVY